MSLSEEEQSVLTGVKKAIRNRDLEYVIGSQIGSTSEWSGLSDDLTCLTRGTVIYYQLPYSSTSSPVTLNLTLADGTLTGAKDVFFKDNVRLTRQYDAGDVIGLVFDGNVWRVVDPYTNTDNISDIDIAGWGIDFDMVFTGLSGVNDDITFNLDLIKGE